ncbi:GNAT family N-acetyltransferase [Brooklawnia cerclae]|uniref:N-acetyltransferase domain-containing protein n=1 Tax=Brooklawnia cerclae TaxID=349934 RepID=A0ABX0SGB7_9ACTN|nr:GNAT family N-acetyltransferase [Brooklawnia cerclae]NIH57423.1 hypothetical protein [Brooklawnia cerclae]
MTGALRVLEQDDLPALLELLERDPLVNLFVASRVSTLGLAPEFLGCPVYGFERGGELVAACHVGSNLVPVGDDDEAVDAFVQAIGRRGSIASIMGRADVVVRLHDELSRRWGGGWKRPRDIRAHQPLMVIDTDPVVAPDPRVTRMTEDYYDAYFRAAVAMYSEEVGVSPLDAMGSYGRYVRSLIQMGRAFGGIQDGRVWFKSDVGSAWRGRCQVQGVWLDPRLRGRGMSRGAMAQVVVLCQQRFPTVSLYVNDFNVRARRLYEAVGFRTVGELATVLF